jgi:hypothetical protein
VLVIRVPRSARELGRRKGTIRSDHISARRNVAQGSAMPSWSMRKA